MVADFFHKKKFKLPLTPNKKAWIGIGFGIITGLLIIKLPELSIFNESLLEVKESIQQKTEKFGINSAGSFIAMGLFYSLIHSFLEEYYWRGFVYKQLQKVTEIKWANALSSLGFMAHHIVILGVLLGWSNPLTYLISICIGLMGSFWAWHYSHSKSLLGPWLSHMIEDAAIFYLGYQLIQF